MPLLTSTNLLSYLRFLCMYVLDDGYSRVMDNSSHAFTNLY